MALVPEWGWTLAYLAWKASLARLMASGLQAVHDLAAAVEAGPHEALGRLVLDDRAQCGQDGPGALVLRRDQLQRVLLAVVLLREESVDIGIGGLQRVQQTSMVLFAAQRLLGGRLDDLVNRLIDVRKHLAGVILHQHA